MSTRRERKNKKRKTQRKYLILSVFLVIPLAFITVTTYSFIQYEEGKTASENYIMHKGQSEYQEEKNSFAKTIMKKEPTNHEPMNVLLVGVDKSNNGIARTDTIMIGQYNPSNGASKIASIMRDSYVEIPGHSKNKINAAFAFGGVDLLRQTIEDNFGLNIHYYALIDFSGFIQLVDTIAPSGLQVTIQERMYDPKHSVDYQPGQYILNGEDTLNYVRFRKNSESDFGRVRRQQEIITILKNELFTFSGMTKIPKLIGMIEPLIETNIQKTKMLNLGRNFILHPVKDIETMRIPVGGNFEDAYYPHAGSVLQLDMSANIKAMEDFFSEESEESMDEDK
ncbi:LCP family protein [Halalkalibacter krulwichiae]|uniref:Regulatory protein MsrR n=1 Tax=Halalkalibacter krulwichiae TaxID=199441 RepID=A0A1X9MG42_9BACI|nr:LCP family protein [Halalkalibacter krulwichiae]ARK31490.1 Regulatory protein MsrR [Halalkalibacter krulwichiae]